MKNTLKKTLSIILAVLMIATTVPFAFAADEVHTHAMSADCSASEGEQITFIPLTNEMLEASSFNLSAGNYYLAEDIYVTDTFGSVYILGDDVNLCYNGYEIIGNMEDEKGVADPALSIGTNRKLSLCDCKGTGGISRREDNGDLGILAYWDTELNMYGGKIVVDANNLGIGINLNPGCVVNMYGGEIVATSRGIYDGTTLNLYAGSITSKEPLLLQPYTVVNNYGVTISTDICDHLCHESGFMGFIWKIVQFISKLFKLNPVCECGVAHY